MVTWYPATRLLPLALLGSTACTIPAATHYVPALDTPIEVAGYTVEANRTVDIVCSPKPYGTNTQPFVYLDSVQSSPDPLSQAGQTVFGFEIQVVVPPECWGEAYGPQTFLRARDAITGIDHTHFNSAGYDCLVEEFFGGSGPIVSYDTCKLVTGATSPWMRIQGPV